MVNPLLSCYLFFCSNVATTVVKGMLADEHSLGRASMADKQGSLAEVYHVQQPHLVRIRLPPSDQLS